MLASQWHPKNGATMDRALTWFIRVWVALAIAVNVLAIIGFVTSSETGWQAWQKIIDTYSPFNVINYALELVLLSPAIGAYIWRERRRKEKAQA